MMLVSFVYWLRKTKTDTTYFNDVSVRAACSEDEGTQKLPFDPNNTICAGWYVFVFIDGDLKTTWDSDTGATDAHNFWG